MARSLLNYLFHSGEITLGSRIPPERQLAEAFGVGRSAIREALKSLSLLGLVKIRQGDGTYLAHDSLELLPQVMEWGLLLGPRGIDDAIEARHHLEVAVTRLAAERSDASAGARLNLALHQLNEDDPAAFTEAELSLHRTLADTADNAVMLNMVVGLQSLLRVWLRRSFDGVDGAAHREASRWEHRAVVEAVAANDPDAAVAAMVDHLSDAARRMTTT